MPESPKNTPWYGRILERLLAPKTLMILLPVIGIGGGWVGKTFADAGAQEASMITAKDVAEIADSVSKKNDAPILEMSKASVKETQEMNAKMDALIDVMRRSNPAFKREALKRAEENRDSKEVNEALTGGSR